MHLTRLLSEQGHLFSRSDFDSALKQASGEFAPRLITRALEILVGTRFDYQGVLGQAKYDKGLEDPYPEAQQTLRSLGERFKIGVIANQSSGTENRLRSYGLLPFISVCLSSTQEGLAKPEPAIFERALALARCAPEEALMVGDPGRAAHGE